MSEENSKLALNLNQIKQLMQYLEGSESFIDDFLNDYGISPLTVEQKKAIVEELKKRKLEQCDDCGTWLPSRVLFTRKGAYSGSVKRLCMNCIKND